MNEFQAALGLLQLRRVDASLARRAAVAERYRLRLAGVQGLNCPPPPTVLSHNHAYFPVRVDEAFRVDRDSLYEHLKRHGVLARRYFFPLITDFPMYREHAPDARRQLPVAYRVASEVLCLPIYAGLPLEQVDRIAELIVTA